MKRINNFGIGTDIENIDRFREPGLAGNDSFFKRIFTQSELDYCFSKKEAASHLAVRFAGKEAVIKALSSIGRINLRYEEIEILNNGNGVPAVKIHNSAFGSLHISLSLSHCQDKAIAFAAVIELNHNGKD